MSDGATEWSEFEAFYREVDTRMQDLPIYHPQIDVALVVDERAPHLAILITPWCINALWRNLSGSWGAESVGEPVDVALPTGEYTFTLGFQERLGAYASLSLLSPLSEIETMKDAHTTANDVLHTLLEVPSKVSPKQEAAQPVSRRGFLRRLSGMGDES